ncbi:MAG: hypothetical protein QOE55_515 [Acidobacteriaceae bacterium]|nr:hypothetical protein [Acidobacteriaceae bacterium]
MLSNIWRRFFSFPAMLVAILFASPFFASLDVQQGGPVMRDPDIWWHLRNAQILLSTHRFIRQDLYSFTTAGQPWINPEWLAEIPYYFGFRLFAERGLFLAMLVAVELLIAGVLLLCYRRSGDVSAAFLATWIAVLLAAINIGPRTILFGWLCFVGQMLLLEAFRRGQDHIWILVPLYAFWINLHGSWLIGYVFFVLFIVSGWLGGSWGSIEAAQWSHRQRRKLILIALASLAAVFINPYGWRLVVYPFDMLLHQRLNLAVIDEWRSVSFQSFYGVLVFVLTAGMLVFTLARRRSWPLHELLFALLAMYMGLSHERFLLLVGVVVCPMLAVELAGLVFAPYEAKRDNKRWLNAAFIAGFYIFAVFHIPSSARLQAAEAQYFPVSALPHLERSCAHRHVLNRYEWGGFLIWNARDIPVFVDSRADIFEYHGVLADYLKTTTVNDSLAILDRYGIGCVLTTPDSQLVYLLRHVPGWHTQFEDEKSILLVHLPRNEPY